MDLYENMNEYYHTSPTIIACFVTFMMMIFYFEKALTLFKVWLPHKLNMVIIATITVTILAKNNMPLLCRALPTDPQVVLVLIHPFIILKVTYNMDTRLFHKALPQVLTLCTIGVAIFTVLMGGAVVLWADLDILFMPLYGLSIASIDDPEFAQNMKEFEHMKYVLLILQGEYIFGAAVSIGALDIVLGFLEKHVIYSYHVISVTIRLLVGGMLVGLVLGKFGAYTVTKTTEPTRVALMYTILPFGTYFLCQHYFFVSAPLATFVVVFMMTRQRAKLYQEIDVLVANIVDSFVCIAECFANLAIWIILIVRSIESFRRESFIQYMVVYITAVIARFLTLLILYPFIIKIGYNWTMKHFVAMFWLTKRGILQVLIFSIICHHEGVLHYLKWFSPHTLCLCILHMLINGAMAPFVMKLIGITSLSTEKITNVNNCVNVLKSEKDKYLATMKLNRYFMDVKWSNVEKEISLEFNSDEHGEENAYFGQPRESHCQDCKRDIVMEPSKKEFRLIMQAAKLRVLKATKVAYIRQQEKGMITKHSLKILLKLVDQARESNESLSIDIDYIKSLFRKTGWPEKLRNTVQSIRSNEYLIPRKPFRRVCYKVIIYKYYELALYVFVLCLFVSDVINMVYYGEFNHIMHLICIVIFSFDVIMKVNAYSHVYFREGIRIYLNDLWSIFDFIILITSLVEFIERFTYSRELIQEIEMDYMVLMLVECTFTSFTFLRMLRVLKIIYLISFFRNEVVSFCNNFINFRVMTAYEIGQAVIVAYGEAIHLSSTYTYNEVAKRKILSQLLEDKHALTSELDFVQLNYPIAAVGAKTMYAIRIVLNHLTKRVEHLKASGFIDEYEYRKVVEGLEKCAIKSSISMKNIPLKKAEVILLETPWLHHFNEKANLIYANSISRSFSENEIIHLGPGHHLPGIYIILQGIVSMKYDPSMSFKLPPRGILPRRDYIFERIFDIQTKNLIPGNSIGEIAVLSDKSYDGILKAVTDVKLLLIPSYLILKVLLMGDDILGVKNYIWKYVAYNMCVDIFWEIPIYMSYSRDDLCIYAHKAFIPDTTKTKIFIASELIEDIVLFEGQVEDLSTGALYIAPCYLPRYVQKMRFVNHREVPVRLFVLPLKTEYVKVIIQQASLEIDLTKLRLLEKRRTNEKMAIQISEEKDDSARKRLKSI